MVRNRKGWLRIVEAVISVMIVLVAVIIVISNKSTTEQSGICSSISPYLDELAKNQTFRMIMLSDSEKAVNSTKEYLRNVIDDPSLNYFVKVCSIADSCLLEQGGLDKIEVCAGERVISSYRGQVGDVEPKKLKIFMFKR